MVVGLPSDDLKRALAYNPSHLLISGAMRAVADDSTRGTSGAVRARDEDDIDENDCFSVV